MLTLVACSVGAGGCEAEPNAGQAQEDGARPEPVDEIDAASAPTFDAARITARDGGRREDGRASIVEDSGASSVSEDSGGPPLARDSGVDAGDAASAPASAFPSVDGKWGEAGPFEVTVEQGGPDHTLYYPTELGRGGLKHPVVIWGNGTGVTPTAYAALLRHWASHGFIVAAANTTFAGSGEEMLAGADWLATENGRSQSAFFGKVDVSKVAATGHSQGGGGAIAAGADPVVTTTMPIEPGPQGSIAALRGPMFILGGGSDTIVNPALLVEPRYKQATHIKAIYGLLKTATHFEPVGDGGRMRSYLTAWLRAQLMNDETAKAEFFDKACGLCGDPDWSVQRNFQ